MFFVIASDGARYGPVDEATVRQWLTEGRVDFDCLSWQEGEAAWFPLRARPTLLKGIVERALPETPPAAPPVRPEASRTRVPIARAPAAAPKRLLQVGTALGCLAFGLGLLKATALLALLLAPVAGILILRGLMPGQTALVQYGGGFLLGLTCSTILVALVLAPEIFTGAPGGASERQQGGVPSTGYTAVFTCTQVGAPTAIGICLIDGQVEIRTGGNARLINVVSLTQSGDFDRPTLRIPLTSSFEITAHNGREAQLNVLALEIVDGAGKVVFSDVASAGGVIAVTN